MSDPNSIRTASKSATSPDRLALLHTLAFTALRLCTAQLDAFTSRLDTALAEQSGKAAGTDEEEQLNKAVLHLRNHRSTFQRLASDCLQRELMQAVQDAVEQAASGSESGAMDLSLITFEAMERKVIIDNLSQAIDRGSAEELAVLGMRIAQWLESDEIGSAHHPFRSAVFLQAVSNAWGTFDADVTMHRLVLQQMKPAVFLQLGPVWQALNQELALRHVLPDAELLYRERGSVPDVIPRPPADEALRQWLAPEGMLHVNDTRAGRLVDEAFMHLSSIGPLPEGVWALLASLHEPVKQAALADTRFFFDGRHPLRRMLESFIAAGFGCKPDGEGEDLLLLAIENIAAGIPGAKPTQFDAMADAFDRVAAREDRIPEARLRAAVAEAIDQENVAQAGRRAEQDILVRIEGGEVDTFIERFLQIHWVRVLAFAYGVRNAKPDMLQKVLAVMDDLLWSVRPKQTPEERKELVDRLPALLSILKAWLNVIKWEGPEREVFFNALAGRHAAAMRVADNNPRHILESRMDAMQRASEHQLARREQEQREEAFAQFNKEIDELDPGAWFEFVRNDGGKVNCKLLWISPGRSRFIFAGKQGKLLFTLDRDGLAQGMRAKRVARIFAGQLVGQALSAAFRNLSAE